MIHVFVGTKAQFIKMAPIMQELDRRDTAYRFINAGQHAELIEDLIPQFNLRKSDAFLRNRVTNIDTLVQAGRWTMGHLIQLAHRRGRIFQRVFGGQAGICLIHGDTLTTLISLLYAKRCGLKVAHVEAGLRSYHLFDPFPEEIIRLIAMRFSDVLFAPSTYAVENLRKLGYADKAVNVGANTILDTVRYARQHINSHTQPSVPYIVVTIHRVETIYSRSRLVTIVALLERLAQERRVLFILHEPTRRQLNRFKLHTRLSQHKAVELMPLQPYLTFVGLVTGADFVITDGGSIQEECFYLNVPCLIMRSKTEHQQGLGKTACLAEFDQDQIERFLRDFPTLRRQDADGDAHPSRTIVDHILSWA